MKLSYLGILIQDSEISVVSGGSHRQHISREKPSQVNEKGTEAFVPNLFQVDASVP